MGTGMGEQPRGTPSEKGSRDHAIVRWTSLALVVMGLHLLLALAYSIIVPPWEAHDEWAHYKYVEYVARYKRLPPQNQRLTTEYAFDEATQPPLYYIIAALPVALALPDDTYRPVVNPYATTGHGEGGLNMAVHDPTQERFPWRGTILALHLARFMSVLLGTLGLWFTWKLARLLTPEHPAVATLAMTIHALVPQYLFIGSVVTNDILLAVLTGAATYLLVKFVLQGGTVRDVLALTAVLVLAFFTKYLALALIPPGLIIAAVVFMRRQRGARRWAVPALATLGITLLAAAWLYRNVTQTGTLLPRDPYAIARVTGESPLQLLRQLNWGDIPRALMYGFRTFWASFGWGNVDPGLWVTFLFAFLCVLAALGWIRMARRHQLRREHKAGLLVIGLIMAFVIALPLLRELLHGTAQLRGRYILGLLTGVSVLLAQGIHALVPRRRLFQAELMLLLGLTGLNLYALVGVIRPTYQPQGLLSAAAAEAYMAREDVQSTYARFGDVAELRAYRILSNTDVRVGEWIEVELLWHVLKPIPEPYFIAVHVLGRRDISYGHMATIPAKGTYPTPQWKENTWFRERYWLQLKPEGPLPTGGKLSISLFRDEPQLTYIPVFDREGRPAGNTVRLGRLRLAPAADTAPSVMPTPYCAIGARIGPARLNGVTFSAASGNGPLLLSYHWQAVDRFEQDTTVFLHLRDAQGNYITGADSPPQQGDFPTGLWRPGDEIIDLHTLAVPDALPPGTYPLTTGLYIPETGQRLPALDRSGTPWPDNAVVIAMMRIDPAGKIVLECPY